MKESMDFVYVTCMNVVQLDDACRSPGMKVKTEDACSAIERLGHVQDAGS